MGAWVGGAFARRVGLPHAARAPKAPQEGPDGLPHLVCKRPKSRHSHCTAPSLPIRPPPQNTAPYLRLGAALKSDKAGGRGGGKKRLDQPHAEQDVRWQWGWRGVGLVCAGLGWLVLGGARPRPAPPQFCPRSEPFPGLYRRRPRAASAPSLWGGRGWRRKEAVSFGRQRVADAASAGPSLLRSPRLELAQATGNPAQQAPTPFSAQLR
jgi:hypothetical protein